MKKRNKSFFERLTGAVRIEDDFDTNSFEERKMVQEKNLREMEDGWIMKSEEPIGELAIDMYQTPTHIIIKTIAAGVKPEDLEISISHDRVAISGSRESEKTVEDGNFYHKELYWGSFARTVMLPEEIDEENSEAIEKHGLVIIRLPKKNKNKQTKLQIKSS